MVLVCVWSLLPCGGPPSLWDHGRPVLWHCDVSLHSLQPDPSHTGHSATDYEDCVIPSRYVYVCAWVVFVLACLYVRMEVFMVLAMILLTFVCDDPLPLLQFRLLCVCVSK